MTVHLIKSDLKEISSVRITGSKSESNRLLLLKALFPALSIDNVSNSDDSRLMRSALESNFNTIDIHHTISSYKV